MSDWANLFNQQIVEPKAKAPEKTEEEKHHEYILDEISRGVFSSVLKDIALGKWELTTLSRDGFTILHEAVWRSNFDIVNHILNELDCPVDIEGDFAQTSLHVACSQGNIPMIKLLLDRGANIEKKNNKGFTPILGTAFNIQPEAMLILANKGANMNALDQTGSGLVHWAAYRNDRLSLRILKAYGFDLNQQTSETGSTPLHLALQSESVFTIEYLIQNQVDLTLKNKDGLTAEAYAISKGIKTSLAVYRSALANQTTSLFYKSFSVIFIIYYMLLYTAYALEVMPQTAQYTFTSLIFVISACMAPILFFVCKYTDAGVVPAAGGEIQTSQLQTLFEYFEEEKWDDLPRAQTFCYTCLIWRPQRSKHCRLSDRCVPLMDHYCQFLNKVIGEKNVKMFVLGLFMTYLSSFLFLYLVYLRYETIIGETYFSTFTIKCILLFLEDSVVLVSAVLLAAPATFYLMWYAALEFYCVSDNTTVNEAFNRHRYLYLYTPHKFSSGNFGLRYENPFTRGFLRNWINFLAK